MKFEIKNPFMKKPVVSDKDLDKIQKLVRESQREFTKQNRLYEGEMGKIRECVAQAAKFEKDSSEYKALRQDAITHKKKAEAYEKAMHAALEVLNKNSKYETMLEGGMTLARLNSMMPDPDEAEKLLQEIADVAEALRDKQDELDDLFEEYGKDISGTISNPNPVDFVEFDDLVSQKKEEIKQLENKKAELEAEAARAQAASAAEALDKAMITSIPEEKPEGNNASSEEIPQPASEQ